MPQDKPTQAGATANPVSAAPRTLFWIGRLVVGMAGLAAAGVVAILMTVGIALAVAYPNLPDVTGLADYRPKLPLRVLSADGQLIGEFQEEPGEPDFDRPARQFGQAGREFHEPQREAAQQAAQDLAGVEGAVAIAPLPSRFRPGKGVMELWLPPVDSTYGGHRDISKWANEAQTR